MAAIRAARTPADSLRDCETRLQRVRSLLEPFYLQRKGISASLDPVRHCVEQGSASGLDPSPLFDTPFYLAQLGPGGVPDPLTPLEHYLQEGAAHGLDPSPLFRTRFYLSENPDVAMAGVNPLLHFIQSGAKEGRRPVPEQDMDLKSWVERLRDLDPSSIYADTLSNIVELQAREMHIEPLLDVEYYTGRYGLADNVDAVRHYIEHGSASALDPSPLFDTPFYLDQLGPDGVPAPLTPLEHYLEQGAALGLDPSPLFRTRFYLSENPDVAKAGVNPLLHFVQSGAQQGRRPVPAGQLTFTSWVDALLTRHPDIGYARHLRSAIILQARVMHIQPLLDAEYYRGRYGLADNVDAVQHYIEHGSASGLDPSPFFDTPFYLAQLGPDGVPAPLTPLEHYLEQGAAYGLDPSPLFRTRFYLSENPDVATAGVNPLLHFIQSGREQGRVSLPLSSPDLEEHLERALQQPGQNYAGLSILANLRLQQGRVCAALAIIEQLKATNSLSDYALEGRILQASRRLPEAIAAFEKSAPKEASRNDSDWIVAEHLVQGAYSLELAEQFEPAIESYAAAIEHGHPDQEQIREHLRTLQRTYLEKLYSEGDTEAALSLARTTLWAHDSRIVEKRLSNVREHCARTGDPYLEIRPARRISPPDLLFLGARPNFTAERGSLDGNPIYDATLSNCIAFSRCNVLLCNDAAVYDLATEPRAAGVVLNDRFLGYPLIRARSRDSLLLEIPDLPTVPVERGLAMFGLQSGNYGHWFLEYLPKMLVFDRLEPPEVPIFVDPGMPATHLECLQLLNSHDRPVSFMPDDIAVCFGKLAVAPVAAHFPFDLKRNVFYDTVWPGDVFQELHSTLLNSLERTRQLTTRAKRPLFVSREGFASRQLVNEAEISNVLSPLGFETIHPETLTFAEQVDAFRNASMVVGSCSSALTNCIFCAPDCPVIGLIHEEPCFNFNGFASFLAAAGVRIIFVQGETLRAAGTHPLHSSFIIAPHRVIEAIQVWGS